jgi:non-ribosomal peptide synthetase component E (peptide arylation enzyme)
MAETILNLIAGGADDAVAITAPDRSSLSYSGLRALAAKTIADMNALGIGRNDRVAIVLPNGP